MSLEEYRRKRSFRKTPEPRGADPPATNQFRFVIQKHHARNLHYDLRLELDGVLKSWAVPKGPSLDPSDKRLAIHVEDHPIEYLHFEGIIPRHEYGGGTVLVWDTGTWEPVTEDGYETGDFKFRLDGHKLQGQWMLVHTGKRKSDKREKNHWLFFKERDDAAREGENAIDILEEHPTSILTGRSLEEVASDADAVWSSEGPRATPIAPSNPRPKKSRPKRHSNAKRRKMPKKIEVPLPQANRVPPKGDDWLHEIKFDGYRMLAFIEDGQARFVSRNHKDWTDRLPNLAKMVNQVAGNCVLDGEIAHPSDDGTTSFQSLQNTIGKGDDRRLVYYVFDLLYLDGYDQRTVPLEHRRALLKSIVEEAALPQIQYSEHIEAEGALVFEKAAQLGAEGIVSKQRGSAYPEGRTREWVKTKCVRTDEFVVGGYTPGTADPTALGALVVGRYSEGALHHEGRVGTGFNSTAQVEILKLLKERESDESPFCDLSRRELKELRPVEPDLVVEIEYGGWTDDRKLRHPSFRGIREDRTATDIQRPSEMATEGVPTITAEGAQALEQVRFTNADRIMYPEIGATKLAIVSYYLAVAERMLPYVANRPLSLVRFPKGLDEKSFFQKSLPKGMHESVRALSGGKQKAVVIDDIAGLIALVQFSALEIHIWGSAADKPDRPDRLVFDLDPDSSVAFPQVALAALEIREILESMDLQSFVMTTGGKGLHVVAPIRRTATWKMAKTFTKGVAGMMVRRSPGRFTNSPSKNARRGKIYIDFLRNSEGATSIAPFSTRAKPKASIATPVAWEELAVITSASTFTIGNMLRRREALEPWVEYEEIRQSLTSTKLKTLEKMD